MSGLFSLPKGKQWLLLSYRNGHAGGGFRAAWRPPGLAHVRQAEELTGGICSVPCDLGYV